jgi:hypothetical protein
MRLSVKLESSVEQGNGVEYPTGLAKLDLAEWDAD